MGGTEERRAYPLKHKKRRLAYAIRRKQTRSYTGIWDRLADEVFILGEAAFDLCTPLRMDSHLPWITSIFIAVRHPPPFFLRIGTSPIMPHSCSVLLAILGVYDPP